MRWRAADSEDPGAIEEAAGQGWLCYGVDKGPGSVASGIHLVESLLSLVDPITLERVEPRIRITTDCPVLIQELDEYRWSDRGTEPDRSCSDHGPDALRYLCMYRAAMVRS